jgi:hypothetical protein
LANLPSSRVAAPSRSAAFAGHQSITVIGGAAGWSKTLEPKNSHNDGGIMRSRLAAEAAAEVGEIVVVSSGDSSVGVDFERIAEPASRLLSILFPDTDWWVGTDGVTRIGAREAFDAKGLRVMRFDPLRRAFELRFEGSDVSQVLPGARIVDSHRVSGPALVVSTVEITYGRQGLRAFAYERTLGNPVADAVRALARSGDPLRAYHGLYEYRVFDMSEERVRLQIVDKRLTGLPDALPIKARAGLAGASSDLKPGSVVLVQFVNGRPERPVVVGFEEEGGPGHVPDETRIDAQLLRLCGGAQFAALANQVQLRLQELATAILTAAVTSGDGGATLQTNAKATLATLNWTTPELEPPTVAAEKVMIT